MYDQFLSAWIALSFTPVLFFIIWTLGSIVVVAGVAITLSFSILAFLIGTAGLILVGTLGITLFLSLVATFWLAVAWAGYRLLFAITNEPTLPEAIEVSTVFFWSCRPGGPILTREKGSMTDTEFDLLPRGTAIPWRAQIVIVGASWPLERSD